MATKQNKSNDNIFEVISYLHVQDSKFGRIIDKFGGTFFFLIGLWVVHGVCFFQV